MQACSLAATLEDQQQQQYQQKLEEEQQQLSASMMGGGAVVEESDVIEEGPVDAEISLDETGRVVQVCLIFCLILEV